MIPPLKPTDDIGKAKLWMDELRLSQLPVVAENRFMGIITEEMLFDDALRFTNVGEYPLTGENCQVSEFSHYYDVLKMASVEGLRIVAIIDDLGHYVGVISTEDVVEAFAKSSSVITPGAILTLKLKAIDYSLSEISRLVEANDAKILASYISEYIDDPSKILLTLKLNVEDTGRVVASLGNHGFTIESSFNTVADDDQDRERLDIFLKYLKI
ncbi:CBS domain-containing protein [Marinoscillum sp. MHG1-6]|uniref:CBS domain-containing protein n=1 Tax=Marinoscillum sp. MHG1-6 TaxID=2959627 RepID=UPI0021584A3B|nr:CBS domain-containing protein [Marinoscillum sp. MHG1-6]